MDHTRSAVQWNCRSVANKKSEIIYLINVYNPFIIAITESWLKPGSVFKLSGFSCLRDDRPDGYGGAVLLIKNSYLFSQFPLPSHDNNNFTAVACIIHNVCFISIYIPHPSSQIFTEIDNLLNYVPKPCVVMGDFNAHHRTWGSSLSNSYGRDLLEIFDRHNLCVLNDGSQTRRTKPTENNSAVDLTVVSPSLASSVTWQTQPSTHGSDHFPIIIKFSNFRISEIPRAPPRMKYKIIADKWCDFRSHIENNINNLPHISQGILVCADSFTKSLLDAADSTFPLKNSVSGKLSSPPWWDRECSVAVTQRRQAELTYNSNMSEENFDELMNIIAKTKKLLKEKKLHGWRGFCSTLSPSTKPSVVWRNIRRYRVGVSENSFASMPPSLSDSFLDRLAPPTVPPKELFTPIHVSIPTCPYGLDAPFSIDELKGVLSNVHDTAPGKDGIPYSFYSHLGDSALHYFLDLINSVMLTGVMPPTWKTQIVLPFLKPSKNPADSMSYRPIALSPVIIKIAEHLVKNRMEWFIENQNILPNSQYGFRKGRSSMDSLSVFTTDIRIAFSQNKSVVATFLDIKSAYDNVLIDLLIKKLHILKIPFLLTSFIQNMLTGRVIFLTTTNLSRIAWKGLPQGSVLSPLLYNIYTYDLEASVSDTVCILQYADDLLLYSTSTFMNTAAHNITFALIFLKSWLDKHGLELSPAKSIVVPFTRKMNPPPINIIYDGISIPTKSHAKFLGVLLDSKLIGIPHCEYVVEKCEKHLNLLRCLTGVWWGAHPFSLKLVYNALIRSTLDYGTYLLEPGRVMFFKKLDSIQARAMRIIMGAMKSSPINALQVECGEPPLHLRRQFLSSRFYFRTLQFQNHQLHSKIQHLSELICSSSYWNHKLPPLLINSYSKYKTLSASTHQSLLLPIFQCNYKALTIPNKVYFDLNIDRNEAHANVYFKSIVDDRWQGWHQVYTDASKHSQSGYVGIGVYHKQYNIVQKVKLPPETSVFTGELFGIVKAIGYVLLMKLKNTIIFSDSMSSLQSLVRYPFRSKTFYPLVMEARSKLFQCKTNGQIVSFAWIPSHCGILGNIRADKLANEAIECGDLFPYKNYVHDLIALPKVYLKYSWNEDWNDSSNIKGKHYRLIQKAIPLKPWFFKLKLGKRATTVLIRMRLGHSCTPAHLTRMKIVSDPSCACGDEFGDLNHIFFVCPNYNNKKFLEDIVSCKIPLPTNIVLVLSSLDPRIYHCLASFIYMNNIKI